MISTAKVIFPFRIFAFCSLYIVLNVVLFVESKNQSANPFTKYYTRAINNSKVNPYMSGTYKQQIQKLFITSSIVKSLQKQIKIWIIVSDVFLALIFIFLIFGFTSTNASLSFIEACLHFIGTVLVSNTVMQPASSDCIICGAFFGVMLPFLLELIQIIKLFCFKTDFY